MKKSLDITILLDKSGSMESVKHETIRGFNNFVSTQKKLKALVNLTLVTFNHHQQLVYNAINCTEIPSFNSKSYVPDGLTALLDTIGGLYSSDPACGRQARYRFAQTSIHVK